MAIDIFGEEPVLRKPAGHEIGQDLSALSLHELDERIGILEREIERIRGARRAKEATRDAAGAFFKV